MTTKTFDSILLLFKHNLAIKLLSLALAVSVWGLATVSRESHHELALPVELQNIPPGCVPNMQSGLVSFTLSGPAIWLKSAARNNNSVTLNLHTTAGPGKTVFNNLEKNLKLHKSVRITRVTPALLEVELLGK